MQLARAAIGDAHGDERADGELQVSPPLSTLNSPAVAPLKEVGSRRALQQTSRWGHVPALHGSCLLLGDSAQRAPASGNHGCGHPPRRGHHNASSSGMLGAPSQQALALPYPSGPETSLRRCHGDPRDGLGQLSARGTNSDRRRAWGSPASGECPAVAPHCEEAGSVVTAVDGKRFAV